MKTKTYALGLLSCLFLMSSSFGQVTPRHLLAKKYSADQVRGLLIPHTEWKPYPKSAAEWRAVVPDSIRQSVIEAAEAVREIAFEPISATVALDFVRSGDRDRYQAISFGKRNRLMELILAESMEDKGRFTEAILNGVWSICEESYWGVAAHIRGTGLPDVQEPVVDLFAAETAALLALADYFVGPKLDAINPLVRKRIYYETNHRLFEPMLTRSDRYGWMSTTQPVNNWNPWIMSNWMAATLLLEKNEIRRADMLHKSMLGLDIYLNGLGEEGGCDEGPSYWFAAGASVYDCLELLERATNGRIALYDEPLIQKMGAYIYKTHIDGHYFVNFADADPKLIPDGLMLYRFGKALSDNRMVQMGQWAFGRFPTYATARTGFHRPRRVENLLSIRGVKGDAVPFTPVQDAWISDIQVLTARTSTGLFLAAHGGHNAESHNHNDVGDFLLYSKGEPIIIDAGRGNYTSRTFSPQRYELWFTRSDYHNLPIVNGQSQKAGRSFEATGVRSVISDKEASLHMDIAKAYPEEAGLKTWQRKVSLNRVKNQLDITDSYQLLAKSGTLQQIFMTVCEVDTSRPGLVLLRASDGQVFHLRYDAKKWTASVDLPSTEGMEYTSFKTKWDNRPVRRIVLTNTALKATDTVQFTLAPQMR